MKPTEAALDLLKNSAIPIEAAAETVLRYGNGEQVTELIEILEDLRWRVEALEERAGGKFQGKLDGVVADELIRDSANPDTKGTR